MINDLGQYFVPEKLRVQIMAKTFESEADSVEPWYGTKYRKEKISHELIEKWNEAELNESFHFPDKNAFIPSKFDIKSNEKVYIQGF